MSIRVPYPCSYFALYVFLVFCFSLPIVPHEFLRVRASTVVGIWNETDRVALLEFKSKISHDHLGVLGLWNESIHFCKWYGVTCSRRHQRVTILDLRSLKLSGSISPHIGNLSFLKVLILQNNSFTNEIPSEIGRLRRLQLLALNNNSIGGEIPANISSCSNLIRVALSCNQLVGKIPSEFGFLSKIEYLSIHTNNLTGSIPFSLGNSSSFRSLFLYQNNLDGSIPDSFGRLKNLVELSLIDNKLSGTIPSSIFNISSIAAFDVGMNQIQGGIPLDFRSTLQNLQYFSVGTNQITGAIPPSISNASKLEVFQAQTNKLTGEVPYLEKLKDLSKFLIATNSLGSGRRNDLNFLCSLKNATRLMLLCISENNFGGSLPGCITNFSRTLEKLDLANNKIFGSIPAEIEKFVNLQSLEMRDNQLSDGFSLANLIGTGSFGSVYRGILDEGRTIVAVKVFTLHQCGASRSFIAECKALRNIRHRNLVKVLTACSGTDYKGDDFKALVFEFMPNGSLEEWLYPITGENKIDETPKNLNLLQRLNIAIDVASALKYLHHDCQPITVHCDLKPSNVLLDDDMTAHVADFGLAKFLPLTHMQTSSIGVRGSIGYIPPEYGLGSDVSTNGDVYSYGILLLELVMRKKPSNIIFEGDMNLRHFAKIALPNHVRDIVDSTLLNDDEHLAIIGNQSQRQARINSIIECLISIVRIGVACTMESPQDRMNMSNVVQELQSIKNILLGPGTVSTMH